MFTFIFLNETIIVPSFECQGQCSGSYIVGITTQKQKANEKDKNL